MAGPRTRARRFRAHSDFVYLTGCYDQPGAACLLDTETGCGLSSMDAAVCGCLLPFTYTHTPTCPRLTPLLHINPAFPPATRSLTLMVQKLPDEAAFWMGPQPSPEELAEMHGADRHATRAHACQCMCAATHCKACLPLVHVARAGCATRATCRRTCRSTHAAATSTLPTRPPGKRWPTQ